MKSLPVLAITLAGVTSTNESAQALVDIVRDLIDHSEALRLRIEALEIETKRLRGES